MRLRKAVSAWMPDVDRDVGEELGVTSSGQPIRLGDLLVQAKVLTEAQLQAALEEQRRYGGRLGSTLVRLGYVTEDLLVKALARQLNIADVDPLGVPPSSSVLARMPQANWESMRLYPVGYDAARRVLVIATFDPLNRPVLDELARVMGTAVEPRLASESRILAALKNAFGSTSPTAPTPDSVQQNLRAFDEAADSNVCAVAALLQIMVEKGVAAPTQASTHLARLAQFRTQSTTSPPQQNTSQR